MRRLQALLATAGLMAALPMSAVAGPDDKNDKKKSFDPWSDRFEWSMASSRARLGVLVIGLTPELREHFGAPRDKGVMIGKVEPKSAAATAGLEVGDIVTDVKGTAVDSADDVLDTLADVAKNTSVAIAVIRDRRPVSLTATLDSDPAPRVFNWSRWFDFDDWFTERERDKSRT